MVLGATPTTLTTTECCWFTLLGEEREIQKLELTLYEEGYLKEDKYIKLSVVKASYRDTVVMERGTY